MNIRFCISLLTKYFALDQYEKETDSTGNVRELYYISGADGVVAVLEKKNNQDYIFYIHKDYLGSYEVISNQNGTVKERYNFDPLGRRRNPSDWSYNNIAEAHFLDRGFTGHEHLDKFGLINMNGRVFDPLMAMFLSPDNFVQSPDLTQNLNRYTYCLNNPLKYVDPSGMTYFKLEGNDWVAFEYNPFTWVGVDFRTASGGGIALEGPSYEEWRSNSVNEAEKNEYGLSGEGENGKGEGGLYYDWVSNSYRFVNNPEIGFSPSIFVFLQGDPTIDKGGFIDKENFYDYMLNHAKNTPVEVGAFELKKNEATYFFILPWKDNDRSHTRFTMSLSVYGLDGYKIINFYHTHPGASNGPSGVDKLWSQDNLVPIWVLTPEGNSHFYIPYLDRNGGELYNVDLKYFLNK